MRRYTRRVRSERSLSLTLVGFDALTRVDALGVNGALDLYTVFRKQHPLMFLIVTPAFLCRFT